MTLYYFLGRQAAGSLDGSEGEFRVLTIVYGVHTLVRTYYVVGERHTVTNCAVVVGQVVSKHTVRHSTQRNKFRYKMLRQTRPGAHPHNSGTALPLLCSLLLLVGGAVVPEKRVILGLERRRVRRGKFVR